MAVESISRDGIADPVAEPGLARCLIHRHRTKTMTSRENRALMDTADRHPPTIEALGRQDVPGPRGVLGTHISTVIAVGIGTVPGQTSGRIRNKE